MIIQLAENISDKKKEDIQSKIKGIGYQATEVRTQKANYLVCIGKKEFDIRLIGSLDGVSDVHRVSDSYKLVSRKWKVGSTEIKLCSSPRPRVSDSADTERRGRGATGQAVIIGNGHFQVMAGTTFIDSA